MGRHSQGYGGFDVSSRETELVPGLHHPAPIVEPVIRRGAESDLKGSAGGGDSRRVVPLQIFRFPVRSHLQILKPSEREMIGIWTDQ